MAGIFIATTTYKKFVAADYCSSLVGLIGSLYRARIGARYSTKDGALIGVNRDALAQAFLDSDSTHLLFIDSDNTFAPKLAETLVTSDKDVIGMICPHRELKNEHVDAQELHGLSFAEARVAAQKFVGTPRGGEWKLVDGLYPMERIGMAFTLISRRCLETMIQKGAVSRYSFQRLTQFNFFQELRKSDGAPIGEDTSFCKRWREVGGDIWGHPGEGIGHIGEVVFDTPFSKHMDIKSRITP